MILLISFKSYGFVLTAHKTAGLEFPENTLKGFEHSLQLPIDAIELDIHLTKDKYFVLSHDPVLDRYNCFDKNSKKRIIIAKTMLKEILSLECFNSKVKKNYKIPSLNKILDIYISSGRFDITLNIEIKVLDKLIEKWPRYKGVKHSQLHFSHKILADKIYTKLRQKKIQQNILLSTFSRELLLLLKNKKEPNELFQFGLLFKGVYSPSRLWLMAKLKKLNCFDSCWWPNWKDTKDWIKKNKIDVFMPNWKQLDNSLFRRGFKKYFQVKNLKFKIYPWTLNTELEWNRMNQYKFDGVITDFPSIYLNR